MKVGPSELLVKVVSGDGSSRGGAMDHLVWGRWLCAALNCVGVAKALVWWMWALLVESVLLTGACGMLLMVWVLLCKGPGGGEGCGKSGHPASSHQA